MKTILSLLLVTFFSINLWAGDNNTTVEKDPPIIIDLKPLPKPIPNKGPRTPSQNSLTCTLMGDCLSVVCAYDVMGEVTVVNNYTLETVGSETGNLGEGIILTLDNYTKGAMTISVTISGTTYTGNF